MPRPLRLVLSIPACVIAAAGLLTACADEGPSPTEPEPGPDSTVVLERIGAEIRGVPGQVASDWLEVRARTPAGAPAGSVALRFRVTAGGGRTLPATATTDATGIARVRWKLGAQAEGRNDVEIAATTRPGSAVTARAAVLPFAQLDALVLDGADGRTQVGVLLDGVTSAGAADDFVFTATGGQVPVGDWRAAATFADEAVVFVPGGRMAFVPRASWTAGPDTIRVPRAATVRVPLTAWIVHGTFPEARARFFEDLLSTAFIYDREGVGVAFDPVRVVDATAADSAAALRAFTCGQRATLERVIGKDPGRINVYVVEMVDGSGSRGQACEIGGDFVAIAGQAGTTLLSHEIGHNLSLLHPDGDPENFDGTNVMHAASNSRAYLTEGQIFRMMLNERSAVNLVYRVRTGPELRSCFFSTFGGDPLCPPMELRLWADGSFPAQVVAADDTDGPVAPTSGAAKGGTVPPSPWAAPLAATSALLVACSTGDPIGRVAAPDLAGHGARPLSGEDLRRALQGPTPALEAAAATAARSLAQERAAYLGRNRAGGPAWLGLVPRKALDEDAAAERAVTSLRVGWRAAVQATTGTGSRR